MRFAFWYTRKTSAGLWIEAQWLWIACELSNFAVGLISPFVTKEPDPYPSFFGFVFALASIAYVPYMATTLLHLERPTRYSSAPWWKRNPLSFRRRRLTRREKKSIALAGTIDSKPFYVVFALCLVLESFAHQPFTVLRPAAMCLIDDSARGSSVPLYEKIFSRGTWAINQSLAELSLLGQAWFNYRAGTFTGKFMVTAIGTAITGSLLQALIAFETWTYWPDANNTPGFDLLNVLWLVPTLCICYQALAYKGVSQLEPVDDDDE